ncbi:MAG: dihydropteroate synthase [Gammaproteobacteria bacterium]|nr:dihydropteroate synthase [Gammaproteobacteria bacterium]NIN61522.1 dihydropteroate synthase [Gammaproteobacteria bacterium]NIO62716.1 dihydropteroate synthase [Gammaproteobacteria bacterium]NIQ09645.1 dihydropteroate synthase [Gammaproteobacteria bacterium]NIQ19280.1 dihydropteroate synthase [Gammaproteobacteria bacterium]
MGILNVTPDSFSDGGQFQAVDQAVKHARRMLDQGADIIDVGGESTRPGSERVDVTEQKARVIPVIEAIRAEVPDAVISIDTTLSDVAESALAAGAGMINDISAGRDDAGMFKLAADRHCPYCLMHMQGTPGTMQADPSYDDVVEEIKAFLLERADAAIAAGINKTNLILDPGIGFGKTREHNLVLMANLNVFVDTGYPILLGASRKRFMSSICEVARADELVAATCATSVLGLVAGVRIFRVHDVKENRQALDVAWHVINSGNPA